MQTKQSSRHAGATDTYLENVRDFSLVCGGPLYRLWRRTRLAGDGIDFTRRRVLLVALLVWLPLLLLSIIEGNAWGGGVALTFLQDIETHARMLLMAPLLILAEVTVHEVLPRIVRQFVERGLVPDDARPKFEAAIASAMRLRDSVLAELLMIAFVYAVGVPRIWRDQMTLDLNSWYATATGGELQATYAGWWLVLVSMPLVQFLCLRWAYRIFIWTRFLLQVSRIQLDLHPAHPDGTAGLLFLSMTGRAFRFVLLALGMSLAGMMANRILYGGAHLMEFKVEIVGVVALLTLLIFGPLVVFFPHLRRARLNGLEYYGQLGQEYARGLQRKWIGGDRPAAEPLLGTPDIQTWADLHNGFVVIRNISLLPFGMKHVLSLAVTTILPCAPLLLTVFSVEQLLDRVLKAILG